MTMRTVGLLLVAVLLQLGVISQISPAHAQPLPPTPPGPTPTATAPVIGNPPPAKHRKSHHYTIWNGSQQVVDRKSHPRHWHGFHVCGSSLAQPYPWCVNPHWRRTEQVKKNGFRFEWYIYVAPKPVIHGYWTTFVVTAMTPAETPGAFFADGTPVYYGGAGTSWFGCPMHLPFGTTVEIPELASTGVSIFTVHDVGYGYCYAPAAGITGRIEAWMPTWLYQSLLPTFWGQTNFHRVFVFTR